MAISEVSLKDAELMAIEEINQAGGLLGKKIEPVIEDGAPIGLLLQKRQRNCSKMTRLQPFSDAGLQPAVKPYCRCLKKITDFCGIRCSMRAWSHHQISSIPVRHPISRLFRSRMAFGNKGKRFFLLGSDYVFPRTANKLSKLS